MDRFYYMAGALAAWFIFSRKGRIKSFMDKFPNAVFVSPNFAWSEFTVSDNFPELAARAAEDWTIATRANAIRLAENALEPIRKAVGKPLIIRSGYRPVYLNTPSGGKPGSQHITASAADINIEGLAPGDMEKIMDWAKENRNSFGQIIFYFHVPVGPDDPPTNSHRVHVSIPGTRTGNVKYHGGGHTYRDILKPV